MEKTHERAERKLDAPADDSLSRKTTYTVDGRRFVVTSVFCDGGETFGSILMRMMKADVTVQL